MNRTKDNINNKLKKFGQRLEMNEREILKSKKTIKTIISACVIVGAITLVGLFMVSRLDPAGLYYMPPSIRDFNLFGRLF
jgi:hypothetical protein